MEARKRLKLILLFYVPTVLPVEGTIYLSWDCPRCLGLWRRWFYMYKSSWGAINGLSMV